MIYQQSIRVFGLLVFPAVLSFGQTPAINKGGVVNAADYSRDLAPGSIVSIFGTNLASQAEESASLPLPTLLGGSSVELVDGGGNVQPLPLFYVSSSQINAQ